MKFSISLKTNTQRYGRIAQLLGIIGILTSFRVSPILQLFFLTITIGGYMIAKSSDNDEGRDYQKKKISQSDAIQNKKMIARALKSNPRFFKLLHKRYQKDFEDPRLKELTRMAIQKYGKRKKLLF